MKKKNKLFSLLFFSGLMCIFCLCPQNVYAASEKAQTVKMTRRNKGEHIFAVIKGQNKKNKTVWRFKTKSYVAPWGDPIKCVIHKDRVYVFEVNKLTVLKKATGKKLWTLNTSYIAEYESVFKGNYLYLIGMSGPLQKVNSKGKVIWSTQPCDCWWHGDMKVKKGKITVKHDAFDDDRGEESKVIYSTQTGQILKIKYLH